MPPRRPVRPGDRSLVRFHPEALDAAGELAGDADPVPMAHVLTAYLNLMSTDVADLVAAGEALAALAAAATNDRERAHATAIAAWAAGDWSGAARRLDDLLVQWPTDVLALMLGHQLDFFTGDAAGCAIVRCGPCASSTRSIRTPRSCAA